MDDLVTWLRVQLDEDEQTARDAKGEAPTETGVWTLVDNREHRAGAHIKVVDPLGYEVTENWEVNSRPWDTLPHIARHDPARVLREVEAKRRILDEIVPLIDQMDAQIESEWGSGLGPTGESDRLVKLLALPYADRPGYREEWRPE